jgi:catechol 2,3-dioxygenase-like lactoylglutathione lyase family enzyme
MKVRIARHTEDLDEVVGFYRDRIGLPETGRFQDHAGYDGVFLEIPGGDAELEFTSGGGHDAPTAHAESLLVLYLDSQEQIDAITTRLDTAPVTPANPYWQRTAVAFEDPDGFQVLLTLKGQ